MFLIPRIHFSITEASSCLKAVPGSVSPAQNLHTQLPVVWDIILILPYNHKDLQILCEKPQSFHGKRSSFCTVHNSLYLHGRFTLWHIMTELAGSFSLPWWTDSNRPNNGLPQPREWATTDPHSACSLYGLHKFQLPRPSMSFPLAGLP